MMEESAHELILSVLCFDTNILGVKDWPEQVQFNLLNSLCNLAKGEAGNKLKICDLQGLLGMTSEEMDAENKGAKDALDKKMQELLNFKKELGKQKDKSELKHEAKKYGIDTHNKSKKELREKIILNKFDIELAP